MDIPKAAKTVQFGSARIPFDKIARYGGAVTEHGRVVRVWLVGGSGPIEFLDDKGFRVAVLDRYFQPVVVGARDGARS